MLRELSAQVAKEAMDGAQTHVSGAGPVFSRRFQTLEKCSDFLDAELFHGELTGITIFAAGELQKEFKAVAVALQGEGTQGPLTRQVIHEEALQSQGEGRRFGATHATPP